VACPPLAPPVPYGPPLELARIPERPSQLWFETSAGYVVRRAFDENFNASTFEVTLGRRGRVVSGGVRITGNAGATEHGLAFEAFTLSPTIDFRINRLDLAFGMSVGGLWVHPARNTELMSAMVLGAYFAPSVELVRGSAGALFLGLRGGVECLCNPFEDSERVFTLSASLGYRM
jgi:hypothetical protein